jgi:hypothetical protein
MYLVDYLEVTYVRTRTYVIDGFVKLVRGSGLWVKQQDFPVFTSAQISRPLNAAAVRVWEIDCMCSLSAAPRRLETCGQCICDVLILKTPYKRVTTYQVALKKVNRVDCQGKISVTLPGIHCTFQ